MYAVNPYHVINDAMSIYGSSVIYPIGLYHVINYPTNLPYYLKLQPALHKYLILLSGLGTKHYNKNKWGFT